MGRKRVMVGQLIQGFHSERPWLQLVDYSLLFLAGPSLPAFQSISEHTYLQATGPTAMPKLMGLGLRSEGAWIAASSATLWAALAGLSSSCSCYGLAATALPSFLLCCTRGISGTFCLEARSFQQGDHTFVPNKIFQHIILNPRPDLEASFLQPVCLPISHTCKCMSKGEWSKQGP